MNHSQTMSEVSPTPRASQMMATEQSQEQQSMQQDGADQRRQEEQQEETELNHSTAVNEILLKLLVTSMYAAPMNHLQVLCLL